MSDVEKAAQQLHGLGTKFDALIFNAGMIEVKSVGYVGCIMEFITRGVSATILNPKFTSEWRGRVTEDEMGVAFQANVFAHYYLLSRIVDLVKGHVVWTTSLESLPEYFSLDDIQGLQAESPYKSSKRLINILHLATAQNLDTKYGIRQYLSHPGISATNIVPVTKYALWNFCHRNSMLAVFYLTRWMGSPWMPITPYKGALASVWCALKGNCDSDVIRNAAFGSGTDAMGREVLYAGSVEASEREKRIVWEYMDGLVQQWTAKLKIENSKILQSKTNDSFKAIFKKSLTPYIPTLPFFLF